ncbi:MAG: 50S ribosomal protein L24 [Parachlamydiaceae bacterium]|nr:50S ribosomal protein L24 [Parachlamydiaceae bacterium]
MNIKSIKRKRHFQADGSKKVRKGDEVMAISGNFNGEIGKVLSVDGPKVVVQGINLRTKHVKRSQLNSQGSMVKHEMPIHVSNVRVCVNGKPVKLKTRVNDKGDRELYFMDGETAVFYRKK